MTCPACRDALEHRPSGAPDGPPVPIPPLGVMPKSLWEEVVARKVQERVSALRREQEETRLMDLTEAVIRYLRAGKSSEIPAAWFHEIDELAAHQPKTLARIAL